MSCVVDTNVPMVANGGVPQASPECVKACAASLNGVVKDGKLVLDDGWLIISEYKRNLRSDGQPGVGDAFLKWVLTNWANPGRCELVRITPDASHSSQFAEFPTDSRLKSFDPADRKFVAVALGHGGNPPIWQAVDQKWWDLRTVLGDCNVTVEFLCKTDMMKAEGNG